MKNFVPMLMLLLASFIPSSANATSCSGANEYDPEAVGKVKVSVEKGSYSDYYRLSRKESATFDQGLQKVLDVILAQPHLKPPHGTNVEGVLRGWNSPHCREEPCTGPIAGQGFINYYYLFNIGGRAVPIDETAIHFDIAVNDLDQALGSIRPFAEGMRDISGREIYFQMRKTGEIDGVPAFMHGGKGLALLVVARSDKPWWKPLSNEKFMEAAIRDLEAQVAKAPPTSDTPAADLYRHWQKERPHRQKEARKLYDEMKSQNPSRGETIRRSNEKLETDMAENFRKDAEREAAKSLKKGEKAKTFTLADRLQRHREVLTAMSPIERKKQAIYLVGDDPLAPPLAKPEYEAEGSPLVTGNPDFFDESLPRTAIQIISVRFGGNYLDPIQPDECGEVNQGFKAQWQTIHGTPWGKIRSQIGN